MHRNIKLTILVLLFIGISNARAQQSESFVITGKVSNELKVNMTMLNAYKSFSIDSLVIYNHLMAKKSVLKHIKGVLLKDVIARSGIASESPKVLSEYYIICKATDGYKIVYSWNELFNSSAGDQTLILTSYDTEPEKTEKGNIAVVTPTDKATGRRFLKGLTSVTVLRVD